MFVGEIRRRESGGVGAAGGTNTWSLIRFCSDPERLTDGRRADGLLTSNICSICATYNQKHLDVLCKHTVLFHGLLGSNASSRTTFRVGVSLTFHHLDHNVTWSKLEDFKISLITFKARSGLAPSYITDILIPYEPARSLSSSDGPSEPFQSPD